LRPDRRSSPLAYDDEDMSGTAAPRPDGSGDLLAAYDEALPHVYGYLLSRCGQATLAEDLTAETFLAAVDAVRSDQKPPLTRAWLIGVARHKLADHWRRHARDQARLRAVSAATRGEAEDPWEARLDRVVAHDTLARLAPQHRMVLTLRYCDDLSVPQVAEVIGRTVHATEGLLVRARAAFRRTYPYETNEGEEGRHG
jgi:RNA polymerase sigma-70 factor, ECF subfamily